MDKTGIATFTPYTDVSPYYFENTKDTRTFVAFAPYYLASSLSLNTTDNTLEIRTGFDYIWAKANDVSYANTIVEFHFVHCMAQLNITVELDETSLGKNATATQEISNFINRGTLSLTDGKVTPYSNTIHYAFDSGKTFTVLPQPEGSKVTVFVGNTAYQTTLPELKAGTSYQFTLTVKNDGLTVKSTIKNWETVEESVTAEKERVSGDITDPSQTWLYDLAFNDGTFMHVTETEGGDIPSSISLNEKQISNLRGIVYYKGDVTEEDPILKEDFPNCTHGLILALSDASSSNVKWMETSVSIYDFQQSLDEYNTETSNYKSIRTESRIGYNNTKILKAYNAANSDNPVLPVQLIEAYEKTSSAPKNSSGWYFLSNQESTINRSESTKLSAVFTILGFSFNMGGWVSTELSSDEVILGGIIIVCANKDYKMGVRAICAY
jgi:hypothetical protein